MKRDERGRRRGEAGWVGGREEKGRDTRRDGARSDVIECGTQRVAVSFSGRSMCSGW